MDKNFEITIKNNNLFLLGKQYDEKVEKLGKASYYKSYIKTIDKTNSLLVKSISLTEEYKKVMKNKTPFFPSVERILELPKTKKLDKVINRVKEVFLLNDKLKYTKETVNNGYTPFMVLEFANVLYGILYNEDCKNKKQTKLYKEYLTAMEILKDDIVVESKKFKLETSKEFISDYKKYESDIKKINDIVGRIQISADKEIQKYAKENNLEHIDFLKYNGIKTFKNGVVKIAIKDDYEDIIKEYKTNKYTANKL